MLKAWQAVSGWVMGGWQQLVTGIAVAAIASAATFVMGINLGKDIVLAGEAKAAKQSLEVFRGEVDTMISKATVDAFGDFDDRLKALDQTTQTLNEIGARQNDNAKALAGTLRGRFVLSPDERLRFECIRRPLDARCASTSGQTVRPAVP
jgi:hypothetical protein